MADPAFHDRGGILAHMPRIPLWRRRAGRRLHMHQTCSRHGYSLSSATGDPRTIRDAFALISGGIIMHLGTSARHDWGVVSLRGNLDRAIMQQKTFQYPNGKPNLVSACSCSVLFRAASAVPQRKEISADHHFSAYICTRKKAVLHPRQQGWCFVTMANSPAETGGVYLFRSYCQLPIPLISL